MGRGANTPLGYDALLFSISGTGSFICPVTQTQQTYQGLYLPSHGLLEEKSKCSGTRQIQTADLSVHSRTCHHQTTMTTPSQTIYFTPVLKGGGDLLPIRRSSAKTTLPRVGCPQGASGSVGLNMFLFCISIVQYPFII